MPAAAALLVLVIRIYNGYGVPASELARARQMAAGEFARNDVTVEWHDCTRDEKTDSLCGQTPGDDEVVLRLVKSPTRTARTGHEHEDVSETLGDAYIDTSTGRGTLATAYPDRTGALATRAGVDRATVLGLTMAHEIGHLLLGTTAHAASGLMKPRWSANMFRRREQDWSFLPGEAVAIHDRLAARPTSGAARAN